MTSLCLRPLRANSALIKCVASAPHSSCVFGVVMPLNLNKNKIHVKWNLLFFFVDIYSYVNNIGLKLKPKQRE